MTVRPRLRHGRHVPTTRFFARRRAGVASSAASSPPRPREARLSGDRIRPPSLTRRAVAAMLYRHRLGGARGRARSAGGGPWHRWHRRRAVRSGRAVGAGPGHRRNRRGRHDTPVRQHRGQRPARRVPPSVRVTIDDLPATSRDLRLGHVVEVLAHGRSGRLTTTEIAVRSEVVGPVDSIERTASRSWVRGSFRARQGLGEPQHRGGRRGQRTEAARRQRRREPRRAAAGSRLTFARPAAGRRERRSHDRDLCASRGWNRSWPAAACRWRAKGVSRRSNLQPSWSNPRSPSRPRPTVSRSKPMWLASSDGLRSRIGARPGWRGKRLGADIERACTGRGHRDGGSRGPVVRAIGAGRARTARPRTGSSRHDKARKGGPVEPDPVAARMRPATGPGRAAEARRDAADRGAPHRADRGHSCLGAAAPDHCPAVWGAAASVKHGQALGLAPLPIGTRRRLSRPEASGLKQDLCRVADRSRLADAGLRRMPVADRDRDSGLVRGISRRRADVEDAIVLGVIQDAPVGAGICRRFRPRRDGRRTLPRAREGRPRRLRGRPRRLPAARRGRARDRGTWRHCPSTGSRSAPPIDTVPSFAPGNSYWPSSVIVSGRQSGVPSAAISHRSGRLRSQAEATKLRSLPSPWTPRDAK